MAPPQLPPELFAHIIELTVELLIEEERHLEVHAPLSNRFLLSAALVDHTWHLIATPILLKLGVVTSRSVLGFLGQVKAHGKEATLESVRFGEASGGVTSEDAAWEDTAFDFLVGSLPGLKSIELLESGSHFETPLRIPPGRTINEVHLFNYTFCDLGFVSKFKNTYPTHLIVTTGMRDVPNNLEDNALDRTTFSQHSDVFAQLQSIKIAVANKSITIPLRLLGIIGQRGRSRLQTCHFESTSPDSFRSLLAAIVSLLPHVSTRIVNFPHLEHFATHILAAHLLLFRGTQPSLTSLEILPEPAGLPSSMIKVNTIYKDKLLELVHALPVLAKLKVPAWWASDALREACEAKGVMLLST
ncbi:hypothetical protein RQP46_006159 [Phenoliferia psychrophenolica]